MAAELISVSLTVAVVWLMVEYGLRVHMTRNIRNWVKGVLQESPKKTKEEDPAETTDESSSEEISIDNIADEMNNGRESRNLSKVSTGHSISKEGSKKQHSGLRKLFRGAPKADEEKGKENGK